MTIPIREDVAYIILKKIQETGQGMHKVEFTETDLAGRQMTPTDLLGHLDYLNQMQYINAEFTGNAYGNQEDVPEVANPKEVDFRIANTFGAADGPLPHLITFKKAELTQKGQKMLEKMEANPPKALREGPAVPIATKDMPFLEKVRLRGNLEDIFDARDVTEVVYRVMRDLMTTEAADRVAEELHKPAEITEDKSLQMEIADLWKDTNPLVGFLSRVRPPWQGPGIFKIDSDRFLFRVANEGGLQANVDRELVVKAVFSATKDELSQERIQEIASWLPEHVRELWEKA
ncbi:DUF2267 domain-containing protein [Tolypothrix bouteillei VB521301]|uniref:DUF2267 domain-containing protein n=3 Tax=Nostocales TaxID=1161 RepID=A0A0C1R585_9CYAN|nr:DUF2267 domain-containing protein [Tolypothrix bouteillei]KAF3889042.1 DUF2267 domain-containing protein [Tolypothrix bouteillei VB521301]